MLRLADLRSGDVVYDLGCGDGRIVIAFGMGNWEAERTEQVGDPPRTLYRWTIPERPAVR